MKRRRLNVSSSNQQSDNFTVAVKSIGSIALEIMDEYLPEGYEQLKLFPIVVTGRHPHRWIAHCTRTDGIYSAKWSDLRQIKKDFEASVPPSSRISDVGVSMGNNKFIVVEYIVNR